MASSTNVSLVVPLVRPGVVISEDIGVDSMKRKM